MAVPFDEKISEERRAVINKYGQAYECYGNPDDSCEADPDNWRMEPCATCLRRTRARELTGDVPDLVKVRLLPAGKMLFRDLGAVTGDSIKQGPSFVLIRTEKGTTGLKCPICMGAVRYAEIGMNGFIICPICAHPYHRQCIADLLAHGDQSQECWICSSGSLQDMIERQISASSPEKA